VWVRFKSWHRKEPLSSKKEMGSKHLSRYFKNVLLIDNGIGIKRVKVYCLRTNLFEKKIHPASIIRSSSSAPSPP